MKARWIIAPAMGLMLAGLAWTMGSAQNAAPSIDTAEDAQAALTRAGQQGAEARTRAEALEAAAQKATAEADRTAQEAAALAARVQQAEAEIAANQARIRLISQQQRVLRAQLAVKEQPLVRLTAAMQRFSRRPPLLALLRPGSLQETVYLRAVLETMLPEVGRQTQGLRGDLARSKALQERARQANLALRASQDELGRKRLALSSLEARLRLNSRQAASAADRENDKVLALAEQTRDLTALIGELDKAGQLRDALAALPGPVPRPSEPQSAETFEAQPPATQAGAGAPRNYLLPAAGRLIAGFGDQLRGRSPSRGISMIVAPLAQVVAPAQGRIAFAGPYSGYGLIVIIEHGHGWTSLVTGLAQLDCKVGQPVLRGSPIGRMGPASSALTLELRGSGQPVNPLDFARP